MCKCGADSPFMRVAKNSPLVIVGEVKKYEPGERAGYMVLDVKKVLKGNEVRTEINVWGDDGKSCRPYVSNFPVGTTWVFALKEEKETEDDYYLSVCGQYWLRLKDKDAHGIVYNENERVIIPLSKLSKEFLEESPVGRKTYSEFITSMSKIQKGWDEAEVLAHVGSPASIEGNVWHYNFRENGLYANYRFTFSHGNVVKIDSESGQVNNE